jgi:hypothetical protein
MYTLCNKNQAVEIFSQTGGDVSVQLATKFEFVIPLYLSVCGFSLNSIYCSYLCQMSITQRHQ